MSWLRLGKVRSDLTSEPATRLKQQGLYAMGMNDALFRRPFKDSEPAVLRRHESNCVLLVVNELRRRKVPG